MKNVLETLQSALQDAQAQASVRSTLNRSQLGLQVLQLLSEKIRPGSSEGKEPRVRFPDLAVSNGTEESLRAFLCVYRAIESIRTTAAIEVRTRAINHTSTNAIGIAWQEATGRRREVQAVLLPTKPRWQGCVEAFLRGHDETPVGAPTKINMPYRISGERMLIDGKPNFHVIAEPSPDLVEQLVMAYKESSLT